MLKKERLSNIELLRIIAMIMIVGHHFVMHGLYKYPMSNISINHLYLEFLRIGGKVGVAIFMIISGYFMSNKKELDIKKLLILWGQIFFYSFTIYIIVLIFGIEPFSIKNLIKNILPVIFDRYWFASCYIILYLFIPYINKLIKNMNKEEYKKLLITMSILWIIIPGITLKYMYVNNLITITYYYLIGGYIKKYIKKSDNKYKWYSIGLYILIFIISIISMLLSSKIHYLKNYFALFQGMNTITVALVSYCIFMTFNNIKIKSNKIINIVSLTMFSVYLIHDNIYIRSLLWKTIYIESLKNSIVLIPYSILIILFIVLISILIDLFRKKVVEKIYIIILNKFLKD
jgi:surface polysaccharide O-acyltransferase-like enzyme